MGAFTDIFLKGIKEREVYYFSSTKIATSVPHHYICIKRTDNDVLILSLCTSKFDTIRKYVEIRKLPFETLVYIPSNSKDNISPFPLDTYINCNDTHSYTIEEFKKMFDSGLISVTGEISDEYYEQIIIGLHKSPLIDRNTKNILPKPQG